MAGQEKVSLFKDIMDRLTSRTYSTLVSDDPETIRKERDALKEELELMRDEYEMLRRAAVEMVAAQKELQAVTYNLVEENKALKQMAHLSAFLKSGGVLQ